jgi:D-amino-acid dehydrogenase
MPQFRRRDMQQVVVLGAGMAGVGAALQLARRGVSVVLLDRRQPGLETSYGNAGIIQREAVEPYAFPYDLRTVVAMTLGLKNDVHIRWRALPTFMMPVLRYLWNSSPRRHARISQIYAQMITHCTDEHAPLIAEAGAESLISRQGFHFLYRSTATFDQAQNAMAHLQRTYDVTASLLTPAELQAAEPALHSGGVGAIHWSQPWSVNDPGKLIGAYADLLVRLGGTVVCGDAMTLQKHGNGWRVNSDDGMIEAEAAVIALGPWAPELAARFGCRVPMVRKRGYHRHYQTDTPLRSPLMDVENAYVMAPMQSGLRLTTGAELARMTDTATPVQLQHAERAAGKLLTLGQPVEAEPWFGTRPCMPDMLPMVGPLTNHPGLWCHFGHGHQGFTLGPTTGRLLAEMMLGEQPFMETAALSPQRFH